MRNIKRTTYKGAVMDIYFDTVKKLKAEDTVRTCMADYQRYLAISKLPHPIDGLKDVTRRAIYVMSTRRDLTKFSQFIASIMELHPHGDGSIRDAVERLFRTYDVGIPLIKCDGNVGSYTEEPAAPRYLNVSSSEFARDLFFNGVHESTIPMRYTVEYDSFEPKYFIPRLPSALLIGNLTIGAGFKSVTLPLNISNVCDLVQRFVDNKKSSFKQFSPVGHEHHFVPDFPSFCELRNYDELLAAYRNGQFSAKIFTDGVIDMDRHELRIANLAALTPYASVSDKLVECMREKNFWLDAFCKDFKNIGNNSFAGGLTLLLKNNVNPWKMLDRLKKLINFTGSITPLNNYGVDGCLVKLNPIEIIDYWYNARYQSITNGLNATQNSLLKERLFISAMMIIVDNKDKVIELIKTADSRDDAIGRLTSSFDITANQAAAICKAPFEKLVKTCKDELVSDAARITTEISKVCDQYGRIKDIIFDDAAYFKKKYQQQRRTVIPKYIGYISFGTDGLHQYSNETEMFSLLNKFGNTATGIYQYRSTSKIKSVVGNGKMETYNGISVARQEQGIKIIEHFVAENLAYTLAFVDDTVSCINGYVVPKDNTFVQYVTRKFIGIHSTGEVVPMTVDEISSRKSISTGARSTLIYAVPDKRHGADQIAVYMSTSSSYTNEVFMSKLYDEKTGKYNKLLITPPDDIIILDIIDIENTGAILNIPKKCINMAADFLYITDPSKLVSDNNTVTINIRSGTYKLTDGSKMKPSRHPDCTNMVVV